MRARALFKSANSFMCKHISFTLFYIFLVLVSESISYINFLKLHPNLAEFLKTNSSFSTVPGAIFNNISPRGSWQIFAENSYVPYVLFGVQLTEAFLFFALIFWAQSLLRKRNSSFIQEIIHSLQALAKAPWMLVLLFLSNFSLYTIRFESFSVELIFISIIILIAAVFSIFLIYAQPLLYDNYYSFPSVLKISWSYDKQSLLILLKCLLLLSILNLIVLSVWFSYENLVAASFPRSLTHIVIGTIIALLFRIYTGLLSFVGYNMIYNHLRNRE